MLKVRAIVLKAARHWLNEQGFVEVQGPVLLPAVGERPHSFRVNYFGNEALLSGGLQPYSDAFVEMLGKVYTVAPTFRAEFSKDKRHLAEFWRIEVAASQLDLDEMISTEENLVSHIWNEATHEVKEELNLLGETSNLKNLKKPFPKLTYDEAIDMLQKSGYKICWGQQLNWDLEHKLSLMFDKPFFIRDFPISGETFMFKANPEKPEQSLCADLTAPDGYGEIASGGETITDKKELLGKLAEMKIDKKDRRWYLKLKQFNSDPQAGFTLGIERLLQWMCKLESIEYATAFPRTFSHIYP